MNPPLRLLLLDDEAPARARLRDLLGDIAAEVPTTVIGEAAAGGQALALVEQQPCDIALVDIRMPDMDGIEFARHLAKLPAPPAVIFVTAYDQYAVSAFELSALDYLLKPVRAARLVEALRKTSGRRAIDGERLEKSALAGRRHLSCVERGRILLVPLTEILYLKAEQKYVTARTMQRGFLLEESLIKLEVEFAESFLRAHRNCLVAQDAVTGIERATGAAESDAWQIILRGIDERIPISRRQWPEIKHRLIRQPIIDNPGDGRRHGSLNT